MTETTNAVPNPGSNEAVSRGCTCPILDNAHGEGWPIRSGETVYFISQGCPIHDPDRAMIKTALEQK